MTKLARIVMSAATAAAIAAALSGCSSTSAYQRALEEQLRQIEEKKQRPLEPLPDYPEAAARYGTSARVLLAGAETAPLAAALKAAGFSVTEQGDMQAAAFHRPDFILCPSFEHSVEYGSGSVWTRTRLVVSVRRPVTMTREGLMAGSSQQRFFQVFARAANPKGITIMTPEERRASAESLAMYEKYLDASTFESVKQSTEKSIRDSEAQATIAANAAAANMMRNAPFREMLANP